MEPISTASALTWLGGAVAGAIQGEVTKAIVSGLKTQINPGAVKKALVKAIDQADRQVPELFFRCQREGLKGIGQFLNQFFAGAAMQELRKPFDSQVKPDVACLKLAFEQALEGYTQKDRVAVEVLEDWLQEFAEAYFRQTNSFLQFEVARQDYCEQLRNAFDDVKFAGIAVEGQEIDRAERLADIFVMPNLKLITLLGNTTPSKKTLHKSRNRLQSSTGKRYLRTTYISRTIDPGNNSPMRRVVRSSSYANLSEKSYSKKQKLLIEEQKLAVIAQKTRQGENLFPARDLLRRQKRAVLLGAPGSGKTTLVNHLAVITASYFDKPSSYKYSISKLSFQKQSKFSLTDFYLPILIRVRDLARHPDLAVLEFAQKFVQRELSTKPLPKGFFEYWLENGQALILLDGLDEVADEAQRYKVVAKIEAFLGQYQENPAIITSRPSGYKRDFFRTEEYPHYELQPFDDGKINEFIDHWYDSRFDLASERQRRKESLRKALRAQPRIKRLARNPLLLTIIALIHRYQAKLPRERYKLYDKAVETLLTSWDANKELSNHEILEYLELDDLRRLMERLAYWVHSQGGTGDEEGGTLIDKDELISQLTKYIREMKGVERYQAKREAERFLELVVRDRAGLLAQQGQDRYAFVHKTFQEYLTAMEIRDRQEEGFEVVLEHLDEHLHDPHWEEVLLLLIAQQKRSNPSRLLQAALEKNAPHEKWLHRNLLFAGMCLAENIPIIDANLPRTIIKNIIALDIERSNKTIRQVQRKIFRILISLYETQFANTAIELLEQRYHNRLEADQSRFFAYQLELQPQRTLEIIKTQISNRDVCICSIFFESLKHLDIYPETVVKALLLVLERGEKHERINAISLIESSRVEKNTFIPSLTNLLHEDDVEIRAHSALSLGRICGDSEHVVKCIIKLLEDKNLRVRYHAIRSLGELSHCSRIVVSTLNSRP